ncbi:MAG: DUF2914 domain-containing protein, partial [Acidobacteriota bacterium]
FRLEDHEQVLVLKWRPARNILLALGALLVLVPAAWVLLAGDSGPTGATALPAAEAARRPQPAASPPPAAASGPRHRQDAGQGNPRAGIAGTSPSPSPVHAGAAARTASPAPSFAPPKSGLRVMESGVGTGVVHRRLVGQRHRFREGGKVWFWTRSVGGHAGELLRHVWIRDGHEVISYDLKVGGPHWRNASLKTLKPGSAGSWTVEARAADGRVLSRRQFVCVPPKKRDTASRAAIR